jgi:hypothetical protein
MGVVAVAVLLGAILGPQAARADIEPPPAADGTDTAVGTYFATTDAAFNGTTPADPVETQAGTINGYPTSVTIEETYNLTNPVPDGYVYIAQQINLDIAPVDLDRVQQLFFYIDTSLLPTDGGLDAVSMARDGQIVPPCGNPQGIPVTPNPCVFQRFFQYGAGALQILSVDTTTASSWNFAVATGGPGDVVSQQISIQGSVGTDPEGDGATPADPVETNVALSPGSFLTGLVTIAETAVSDPAPSGYSFIGQAISIEAPVATVDAPLVLTFAVDDSILNGADIDTIQIFRNAAPIPECSPNDGSATPDPCITGRSIDARGDVSIRVLTSHASEWNVGRRNSYAFGGFYQPVDNGGVLNRTKAGSAVPVKFSLGGSQGLVVLAGHSPTSTRIDCANGAPTDDIEQTVSAGASSLRFDASIGQYVYTWKTDKSWAGTCRQLDIRLADGTHHRASFQLTR